MMARTMKAAIAIITLSVIFALPAGAVDLLQAGQPALRQGILLDVPTSFKVLQVIEDYPLIQEENKRLRGLVGKQEALDEIRIEREKLYQERIAFLELQAEKWKQLNDATLLLAKQNREMQGSWWDRLISDMGKYTVGALMGGVVGGFLRR